MNRFSVFSRLVLLIALILGLGAARGQTSDSTFVVAWGANGDGQCDIPEPNAYFVAVAGGAYHSLGLKSNGSIAAWGRNDEGQCDVSEPNSGFVAVAAGYGHSLGLKSDGRIVAWGQNYFGECDVSEPNEDFVAIAGGWLHSLGLKSNGTIMAWGTTDQYDVPEPNSDFIAVAAGSEHSLGLKSNGTIVAWGGNDYGQCDIPEPNSDFVAVVAAPYHSICLKLDGAIVAWGRNDYGQCDVPEPNADFIAVATGWEQSLGLKSDGTIVAWGYNNSGQCDVPEPNVGFIAIAGGYYQSLGIKSEPTAACFVDATSEMLGDTAAYSMGVAWGDYDNDGDWDIYLSNCGVSKLFRNDGDGIFSDATNGPLADGGYGHGVAWGDCDNDEDLDLYIINNNGSNKLLRNDGDGIFSDITSGPLDDAGSSYGSVAWIDYDNDGDLDLYVAMYGRSSKLFRNEGGCLFTDATTGSLLGEDSVYDFTWGDYDKDGDLDLYLATYSGANKLYRNDGGGSFVDVTSGPLGDTGNCHSAVWGDYDNDGDIDLYITNRYTANKLLRNEGGDIFSDSTSGPLGDTGYSKGAAWGDYDNDGDLDLYITNYFASANKLLRNDGGGVFVDATEGPLGDAGSGTGVGWGDYDNDGDLDIYFANNDSSNKLLQNNCTNGNHWLQVRLKGHSTNTFGIGAQVRIVSGDLSQIREITGCSGSCSQSPYIAAFGLGPSTYADTLEIRWPSGMLQTVLDVSSDQLLEIVEKNVAPDGLTILDVPGDQGGKMTIQWDASGIDVFPPHEISYYSIWRRLEAVEGIELDELKYLSQTECAAPVPESGAVRRIESELDYAWEWIVNTPARQFERYAYTVQSLRDSIGADPDGNTSSCALKRLIRLYITIRRLTAATRWTIFRRSRRKDSWPNRASCPRDSRSHGRRTARSICTIMPSIGDDRGFCAVAR